MPHKNTRATLSPLETLAELERQSPRLYELFLRNVLAPAIDKHRKREELAAGDGSAEAAP